MQIFHYTLKLLKYQWNMISKDIINDIKTTYNKSFKSKLKFINLTSVTSVKKANT